MSIPEGGTILKQFDVTGMSCAACSARVEKAVSHVPGVTACAVSLLTNSMGVEGSASPDAVIAAVRAAGYGAKLKLKGENPQAAEKSSIPEKMQTGCRYILFPMLEETGVLKSVR